MNVTMHRGRTGKPEGIIVDMDGTLVDTSSIRHLIPRLSGPEDTYSSTDFDEFHEAASKCPAIWKTVDSTLNWYSTGRDIIVVTARSGKYRKQTEAWLKERYIPYDGFLFMRDDGDVRSDYYVKKDILEELTKRWDIVYAIDDNPSIIKLWQESGIRSLLVPGWEEA